MAQTSTRRKASSASTRSRQSGNGRRSPSTTRRTSSNGRRTSSTTRRSSSNRSRASSSSAPRPARAVKQVAAKGKDAVSETASKGKDAVSDTAQTGGKAIATAADKVKWPAVAGGAALAGLAGGVALGAKRTSDGKSLGVHLGNGGGAGKRLLRATENLGRVSENVGQFAGEVRRTRETIEEGSKHRSPIEVLLRALTARR